MCQKIKDREIDKRYLCIVHGVPKKKTDTLIGYLEKNEEKNKAYICKEKSDSNRTIKTRYKLIASKGGLSLLEIELLTGRTHQIRVHMASIGHPLLGDGKYGKLKDGKALGFNKQALYSYKLSFCFSSDASILNYLNGKTFTVKDVYFTKLITDKDF